MPRLVLAKSRVPVKIVSFNANGIRAAARKGWFRWMLAQRPDFVCVQETKARLDQLSGAEFHPCGYHAFYNDAEKRGYSGVALYSRHRPDLVRYGLGLADFDREGRWLEADFGPLTVVSLYMPSGTSGEARQAFKYEVMDRLLPRLVERAATGRETVICGDWNIAHREIDLRNWKSNQKNSGFLPEERAWFGRLFDEGGWVDVFRRLEPGPGHFTWWSNRGRAWEKNVGWRIDYHVATPGLAATARSASVHREDRFSDHAPLTIEYDFELPA